MKFIPLYLLLLIFNSAGAQSYIASYGAVTSQVSQSNVLASLTEFQGFGIKYRGTPAQANALAWLEDKYLSYGFTSAQITEDPFSYSGSTCKNLVVTKTGTTYPDIFVIIGAHYDTVNGPGTNDNGSGTAVMLEIARLLVNVPTEYSIRFIHFAGEEDGLVGSNHYVNSVVNATNPKMNIRLMLNLDQVGGVAGGPNTSVTCERDQSNPTSNNAASNTMTQQLMACVTNYSALNPVLAAAYGSDYVPFENNGEIITGLYETNESSYPHTANDLLVNMDPGYVFQIAKASVGAALHFAVACETCNLDVAENFTDSQIALYPNPAKDYTVITIDLLDASCVLADMTGKVVRRFASIGLDGRLDLTGLAAGEYLVVVQSKDLSLTKKLLVVR